MGGTRTIGTLRVALLAALLLLGICFAQDCFAYTQGSPEFRAFWVDGWDSSMLSQSAINTMLGQAGTTQKGQIRDANCNAIFLEVRRNADACYPSVLNEPYWSNLSPGSFNALQAVINAAHDTTGGKQRIEVHAWIVTFRTGGGKVYGLHHDTATGSLTNLDNYWQTRDNVGNEVTTDSVYPFDPGHPGVENYLSNLCMDLVGNYSIDGIHFDYIRYTASTQGYNPTSVARYNARYGASGTPSLTDTRWKDWRRDQISALVRQVYAKVQALKPQVLVSGSFYTGDDPPSASTRAAFFGTQAYKDLYSDWDSWVQEGIVDMAVPMTYYDWSDSNGPNYVTWMNFEKDRKANRHMIVGPGLYLNSTASPLNSLADSIIELQKTRDPSPSGNYAQGFSGFSHKQPYAGGSWSGFASTFVSSMTSGGPVAIPTRPWKSAPTKGHISGQVTYASNAAWADGASVTISGPDYRTQFCDGTGFYAFIDVTPGYYTMTVSKAGFPDIVRTLTVAIGSVTGNMYVNNFQLAVALPPPVISSVAAGSVTTSTASLTWNTDQAATSQVQYGYTTSYGYTTTLNSANVTAHTVNLSGLGASSTYHYRVISTNSNGSTTSGDYTFTTLGPPIITSVTATNIAGSTATITWTTNQPASSRVDYGLTNIYGSSTATDSNLVTSHSMTLTGLTPNTLYHYHAFSSNANGNMNSGDYTFTTTGLTTISNVRTTAISNVDATVAWNTDMNSDSQVEYGLTTSYGSTTPLDSNPVVAHSVSFAGLVANTIYNYRVRSTNAGGTAVSGNYTFTTNGPPLILTVAATNITSGSATITWATNNASDSTVNYGPTTGYGSQGTNSGQVTNHSLTITGLAPNTPYHYQCVSTNIYGTATATDRTFTTTMIPTEIIVDNTDPGWLNTGHGSWKVGAVDGVPRIGTDYLYAYGDGLLFETAATKKCTWTPYIPQAGLYDVYVYYQLGPDRNQRAPYTVHYYGGQSTSVQNQKAVNTSGDWFRIGQNLPFGVGSGGYVELTTLSSETKYISADAAKFVFISALDLTPPDIAVGEPSTGLTTHGPVSYTVNYDGADFVTLGAEDVVLNKTGTADAVVSVTGSGTSVRTVILSSITGDGTLGISLAAGTASDNAGNFALAAGPSDTFSVDNTAPSVSIGAPSVTSTDGGPIDYIVSYTNADAVTLSAANITLVKTGTANATITVSGGGASSRTVSLSNTSGDGTLGISIAAGTASDIAGNLAAACGPSATASVDNTAPTVSIGAPSVTATTTGPVSYTVTYVGADTITLAATDVVLQPTGTATGTVMVSGTGNTSRTVTISSITGSGTLGISLGAETAVDAVGNAAPSVGSSSTFSVDNTAPVMGDVTDEKYTTSTTTLQGWWSASDSESGIKRYEYAVGTTPLGTQVKSWTSAGTNLSAGITGLSLTVGSTYYVSARAINTVDLVSTPSTSAGVQIAQSVASIQAAKTVPDGKAVALPARVVSATFPTAFYLEEDNRASGVRVQFASSLYADQLVTVMGTMGVTGDGERAIFDPLFPNPITTGTAVQPFMIVGKAAGGAALGLTPGVTGMKGLNNTGLLVNIAGTVTAVVSDGFYLDDGSKLVDNTGNTGIKVWTGAPDSAGVGSYVKVTGVVSLSKSGAITYPQILARNID